MIEGTLYNNKTGEAISSYHVSDQGQLAAQVSSADHSMLISPVADNEYVDLATTTVKVKVPFIITADKTDILNDGTDAATLTLPDPCWIEIHNVLIQVTGGSHTITSAVPDMIAVELKGAYSGTIIIVSHSLVSAKTSKATEIQNNYLIALHSGFTYAGNTYDSDETSMNMISGAAGEAARSGVPAGFVWKTQNNQLIPMSKANLNGLAAAMFAHINTSFGVKETKKAQLASLTLLADVLNFNTTIE